MPEPRAGVAGGGAGDPAPGDAGPPDAGDAGPPDAGEAGPPEPSPGDAHDPTAIWPPVEPDLPDGGPAATESDQHAVAEQFPDLDPQLVQEAVAVTASADVEPGATGRWKWESLRTTWLASRYPLLGVALILTLLSLPRVTQSVVLVVGNFPVAGTLTLLGWVAYAFPLVWLINRFDFFEREPFILIAMALAWGGVIATSMAVPANQAMFSLMTSLFGEDFTQRWGAALAAPTTEESLKAIGIIAVVLLALRGIRSAIDGFVVGAMVGLGFQVVENFVYTGNLLLAPAALDEAAGTMLNVFFVRGIGAGLWSHAAYSGVAGLGIGYAVTRTDRTWGRRVFIAAAMLGLAWFMHFLWNLPVLVEDVGALGPVLKAAIILALLLLVVQRNQGRQSMIYTEYLEQIRDPAVITVAEIEDLRTYRTREPAARAAARWGGERPADAVRGLQRRQADLSVALANGDLERAAAARAKIARARNRMATAALLPPRVGYRWGVASLWVSVIGVLVPVIGPLVAALLAWMGVREARQQGAAVASTVRAAWPVAGISLLVGLGLVVALLGA